MKRALSLFLVVLPVLPFAGCSSEDVGPEYPSGGTGTTAGSPGSSGSTSTSGSDNGTAGTTPMTMGGMTGTGGDVGSSGSGGAAAGSGTGGAAAGSGTGGAAAGSGTGGATGGSGGAAGGAGGSAAVSLGKLDGFLLQTPCTPGSADDCVSGGWLYEGKSYACSGGNLDTDAAATKTILDFPVTGGEKGKIYTATMHFYGIMEPKIYGDNIQREAAGRPGQDNPANPAPFAWSKTAGATFPASDYNTYEVHVIDDKGAPYKDYYLNADTQQGHWTFVIDYERPIEIVGGGKIHIRSYDSNCRMIKNCGANGHQQGDEACASQARTVAGISAAMPAITVSQPALGKVASSSGQWFAIDVKTIVPK